MGISTGKFLRAIVKYSSKQSLWTAGGWHMRNYFCNVRDTNQPSISLLKLDFLQQVVAKNFKSKLVTFQYRSDKRI